MSSIPITSWQIFDNAGDPASGAKVYTYEAGTTTPLASYSDVGLTSANANPIVADANGRLGAVYLKIDQAYKIVVKNSGETTTYISHDNVWAANLASNDTVERLAQVASNPLTYGAIGDGAADESADVQTAIDAATGAVDLLGKTFRCDNTLTVTSGLTIKNGTLDFSNCTDTYFISMIGTLGTAKAGASNIDGGRGDAETIASGHGFVAGDLIFVADTQFFHGSVLNAGLVRLAASAATTITPENAWPSSFLNASAITFKKVTGISNVRFENVTVIGHNNGATSAAVYGLHASNLTFAGCKFKSMNAFPGIYLESCYNTRVEGCDFTATDQTGSGGVSLYSCESTVVHNCLFSALGTGVNTGAVDAYGPCRRILVKDCRTDNCNNGLIFYTGTEDAIITGCELFGDGTYGVFSAAAYTEVTGCTFYEHDTGYSHSPQNGYLSAVDRIGGCIRSSSFVSTMNPSPVAAIALEPGTVSFAIDACNFRSTSCIVMDGDQTDVQISNCSFLTTNNGVTPTYAVKFEAAAGEAWTRVSVLNCTADGNHYIDQTGGAATVTHTDVSICGNQGLKYIATSAGVINKLAINGNKVVGGTYGIWVDGVTAGTAGANIQVNGNVVLSGSTAGIFVDCNTATTKVQINSNEVTAVDGIVFRNDSAAGTGNYVQINDNRITATSDGIIWNSTPASQGHTICGNVIRATALGIDFDSVGIATGVTIAGNNVNSDSVCLDIDGKLTCFAVTGNVFVRTDDLAACVTADGAGGTDVNAGTFAGNVFNNGTYGIAVSNNTELIHDGNVFTGQATAITNGTFATAGDSA